MRSNRVAIGVALAGALVLAGAALFVACGSESTSERSERRRSAPTTTGATAPATTPTSVAPRTVPVPPTPPPGPTTAPPPPISVPTGGTAPRTTTKPRTTTTPRSTTTAPGPSTSTPSSTTKPGAVTRKTVVYSPSGAPKRKGDLSLPRQHGDTMIVLAHGGDRRTGSRKQMRAWADYYAEHGYPTFAIDYLLARPPAPSPVYPKPETDVKAAVQFLRGRAGALGVDPNRIVVQGFGDGATLGGQAEVTPDDPFFDGSGRYTTVSDAPAAFVGFYGRYDGRGEPNPTYYYGGPADSTDSKVQERYAAANSVGHASGAVGPVLLVQGDADTPELVASATAFRDALQSASKDVTLSLVPGAGAGFDQDTTGALTPEGQQVAQQVLDWLQARFPPTS